MKIKLFLIGALTITSWIFAPLEINTTAFGDGAKQEPLNLLIATTPAQDKELADLAQLLGHNLQRSGQFKVTVKGFDVPTTQSELNKLLDKSFPLEIFLSRDGTTHFSWRLYDVHDGRLIKGMKYAKRGRFMHGYADNIADELWPVLTKQAGSFSTKIGYVKRKQSASKRQRLVVCVVNSDGSNEQELIKKLGTYVSLYWHHDKGNPCLFCSEFTRSNVRLISANFQGRKKMVLNVPGTCVGISVSHDNNKAVYCRSGTIWQYSYNPSLQRSEHTVLIKNEGKNVSPTLLENGDVIFCSDSRKLRKGYAKATGPQICHYHSSDGSISLLTQEGYCVGPSYCQLTRKVAYSKKVNGVMQLCVYDCNTKGNHQITFDQGHKIDCCWSPCGNYIVYCQQQGAESRIAMIHVAMRKRTFITSAHEYCTCPAWSPIYDIVPVVGTVF